MDEKEGRRRKGERSEPLSAFYVAFDSE